MNNADLLALAEHLAQQAGAAILDVRARGFATEQKADRSVVTEADRAAEAIITAGLRKAAPGIPVVAEEEVAAGHVPDTRAQFWLVDPLDGTREFTDGRDEFTVNIGLIRDGRPVLGVVYLPALREMFAGLVGEGAWKGDAQGRRTIRARRAPPEGVTVLASRHHGSDTQLAEYLRGIRVAATINAGSALKFCRVAEGAADLYPRFGPTMEWDTAAPQAVLEAAGGRTTLADGITPLGYGKPGWKNPHFICVGVV